MKRTTQTRPEILAQPDAVNVAHTVERCGVLGPGWRYVVWVQGCPLRCPGCSNPELLAFRHARWLSITELEARVLAVPDIDGITFSGGEPFAQAEALAALSSRLRRAAPGLSLMAYSGFTLNELQSGCMPHAKELLAGLDLLMEGPYVQTLPTRKLWRGSDNQRLIALSERYRDQVAGWNEPVGQTFEVRIQPDGGIEILGIAPPSLVADHRKHSANATTGQRCQFRGPANAPSGGNKE